MKRRFLDARSQGQSRRLFVSEPFEHELEGGQQHPSHHTPQIPSPEIGVMAVV